MDHPVVAVSPDSDVRLVMEIICRVEIAEIGEEPVGESGKVEVYFLVGVCESNNPGALAFLLEFGEIIGGSVGISFVVEEIACLDFEVVEGKAREKFAEEFSTLVFPEFPEEGAAGVLVVCHFDIETGTVEAKIQFSVGCAAATSKEFPDIVGISDTDSHILEVCTDVGVEVACNGDIGAVIIE